MPFVMENGKEIGKETGKLKNRFIKIIIKKEKGYNIRIFTKKIFLKKYLLKRRSGDPMIAYLKGERKRVWKGKGIVKEGGFLYYLRNCICSQKRTNQYRIFFVPETVPAEKDREPESSFCSAEKDENQPEFCLEKRAGVRSRPGDRRWKGGDENYIREGSYFIFNHV